MIELIAIDINKFLDYEYKENYCNWWFGCRS